jgi:hypothetical protein
MQVLWIPNPWKQLVTALYVALDIIKYVFSQYIKWILWLKIWGFLKQKDISVLIKIPVSSRFY